MGDTRRTRALVIAALMVAAGLQAVASAPAAVAAGPFPSQCVERIDDDILTMPDYPAASLIDLDIAMPNNYNSPDEGPIELVNGPAFGGSPTYRWTLTDTRLDWRIRSVVFDNEAPPFHPDPTQPYPDEVRIAPSERYPYFSPSGDSRWSVQVDSPYGGAGRQVPFAAILTWSDCDADNDYVGDAYRDNCVGVPNRDQLDRDGDGLGDACDTDNDNDGVADASDNCPATANTDQTDWDFDRVGNACDATPGTAPIPPTTPSTPTAPTPPGTSTGCTAGCAYARTVGLRHRAARHRFTGTVDSLALGCRSQVEVTLWRKRSGDDRKLVVVTTRATGKFRTKAPRRAGRYYATVGSVDQPLCSSATSHVVKVGRR